MKKVDQVAKNGRIVSDYDQTLTTKQIDTLYHNLFENEVANDGKQHILFGKIGVLTANVTYLGHPHPLYKKRIQLKDYYPDYYRKNEQNGLKTVYVGIYSHNDVRLYVVFEPSTYAEKKSHNSSAHIYSTNLQYAQRTGEFSKVDAFGNKIHVFKRDHFIKFIKTMAGEEDLPTDYEGIMELLNDYLGKFAKDLPLEWQGVPAYQEMVENNYNNARQNRWPGWYFEYLFQQYLNEHPTEDIQWNSDKKKGGIDLDLVFPRMNWVYGDAKADQIDEDILGNNFESFDKVINEHDGTVYYICVLYKAEKDSEHGYEVSKFWNSLRDADKAYTSLEELKSRAGKAMKYSVKLRTMHVLKIDKDVYEILKRDPFHQGRNSDGKPRADKLKVKKDMISALSIYQYNF